MKRKANSPLAIIKFFLMLKKKLNNFEKKGSNFSISVSAESS